MSKTIVNYDSHVILYAKGHYKQTNMIGDLTRIYSLRNGLDPTHVNKRDILRCLINLVEKLSDKKYEIGFSLLSFLSDIDPKNFCNWYSKEHLNVEYDFIDACITKCLSLIRMAKVKDNNEVILQLDEPDESILPLQKRP